ncbi:3-phosphoshikimate 1-carboxyvinyltransferase [Candidatus Kinetoplastibacterium oncopeltii TCC290E]|uniref:3-phosphoshikimate 1-carboxyvinyltransferase n=1 Tax=Candidatus Kinetoplastidibacterium stringomonadis TCC290E TaxID=1208920 RepID=M1LS92_9PROT|nr:3-phosphoshikimate 1-carboxyvinyltransferase [Candidatus Kinetoplastibacterium oncopeltii]AGF48417.1 3-phosphoshikimate 1-carboxyvinyltransferase [Candidatus Kinetoplastibacterium oncopeltii TCC290E]
MNKTTLQPYLYLNRYCGAKGDVILPGSKSISNRVLLISALSCDDLTEIKGLLYSDDTNVMIDTLIDLGIQIYRKSQDCIEIIGRDDFNKKCNNLFLGNAGTAFRPIVAALSFMNGNYIISGVPRMHERPIADLVDSLRTLGCNINYIEKNGYPPLEIKPFIHNGSNHIFVNGSVSSQFLTALLIASPILVKKINNSLTIEIVGKLISKPYIDITLNLMRKFGVNVENDSSNRFVIDRLSSYKSPGKILIEGDASSASYFLALGAIGGGPVRVNGIGHDSIQGDVAFSKVLAEMGADIKIYDSYIESSGFLVSSGKKLKSFDIDFNMIPDAAMTAAVLALYADGKCFLRNIGSWRVKETDRIHAMHTELSKFGVKVESGEDWISIDPIDISKWPEEVSIDTWDDHRMAMCFSLATFGNTKVKIMNPSCVNKTFPNYFSIYNEIIFTQR